MEKIRNFLKTHQQVIVLVTGYILVATLGFGLGKFSDNSIPASQIRVEQAFAAPSLPSNYNSNISSTQTTTATNCQGKIKGSSSMIYHVPGGAFYDKTTKPIRCFDTEAEAQAAGFRKSSR